MTPLLGFIIDCKPTGLKKGTDLGIVTAEVPQDRAVGKDKTHDGRVGLKNIDWSELRDAISKDPGIGSLGLFRSIAQEVANSFSSGSQREIWFSSEHRGQPEDSGNKDKKERGTVGLAGAKDALNAERGETTLDAPECGEKERGKMTVGSQESGDQPFEEMPSELAEQLPAFRFRVLERGEERVVKRCPKLPFEGPVIKGSHVIRPGAWEDSLLSEVTEGGEIIKVCAVELEGL